MRDALSYELELSQVGTGSAYDIVRDTLGNWYEHEQGRQASHIGSSVATQERRSSAINENATWSGWRRNHLKTPTATTEMSRSLLKSRIYAIAFPHLFGESSAVGESITIFMPSAGRISLGRVHGITRQPERKSYSNKIRIDEFEQ